MDPITRIIPQDDRAGAITSLARLLDKLLPGVPLLVTVARLVRKRTELQNAALWGCAYKHLRQQTGNDHDDLHIYFCGEYFGWIEISVLGKKRLKPRRTTTRNERGERAPLSTLEFADFYDFIQRVSAIAGYDVPDPDPAWREQENAEA